MKALWINWFGETVEPEGRTCGKSMKNAIRNLKILSCAKELFLIEKKEHIRK